MALSKGARSSWAMLVLLNLIQLVLYIPLLALAGQGALYVLAGPKRDSNFFYRLLQLLSKPFTVVVRKLTPKLVADAHVPIVTFFLVLILYFVVTFERIDLCMRVGLEHCR
jgi:cytochrome b561